MKRIVETSRGRATMPAAVLLVLMAALAAAAAADAPLVDPTRPPAPTAVAPGGAHSDALFRLESTLVSAYRRIAVINGVALVEGERIDGALVAEISRDKVVLRARDESIVLKKSPRPDVIVGP